MNASLLSYLACPACESDLELGSESRQDGEITSGELRCSRCPATFPIVRGIPRMNASLDGLERVARSFDHEWAAHHEGAFEEDTLFGRTQDEAWRYFVDGLMIDAGRVRGATVLDAGCGPGFFSRAVASHEAKLVIGVDMNDAVDVAAGACRELSNVEFVQANIFALPFKPQVFDLVWCAGVLHHTPDPPRGHQALARLVKPRGVMFVWVYARRLSPFRLVKDVLAFLRVTRLPPRYLMALSRALALVTSGLLGVYRFVRRFPPLRPRSERWQRTVRPRSFRELYLRWFDSLSPQYDSRHTEEEVTGWFRSEGFTDVRAIDEPKVGVRGVAT
jgi:2-polyprenyl-3-methyl-5-hydroxy-6-metoxy-1,4-benzoquinol methylase/uncharacterized protein YbaR (Trm112 family)